MGFVMFAKAFRLFVSSTFQDFGEERRLLQERVFPALEAHCAKAGFGFRAVDMRWGVNGDAQLNQRTAEICLGEVIEAKGYPAPNLLILIGDRYGWVPLPFAIARDDFEAMRTWLAAQEQNEAVSDLDRVYALDENHLVPGGLSAVGADLIGAYTLRSREDDLSELKSPEAWAPVEALLREALQAAARNLHAQGQLRDAEIGKYTLSLTEQEIRKGLEQLAAGDGAAAANSIAWVRTTQTAEPPVQALAEVVKHALPEGHVLQAPGHAESAGYGEHFVEQITARLIGAIDGQIADFKARAQAPDFALQTERAIHVTFAAERLRVFVGRASNLAAIAAHIGSEARHPLVLTGISGSGKTALMAKAAAETRGKVVQRFVGASASSANQRNLLISVIEELTAVGVATKPEHWEDDDNRFVNQVRDLLAALDQPVTIFIDALNQLRAPYRPMWLPPQLHPKVKLIVSVLDDEAFAAERPIIQGLRRSLPAEAFLAIEPLSEKDGTDILAGLKREAQRGLSAEQEAYILEQFEAAGASPLYLRIAFAIARRWRSTDDPRARGLAGDVTALIGQFLDELSSVHHHEPLLVRRALGLIAAGREGLSESEAIAVLSRDADVMAAVSSERFGAVTDRLPDSVWVRLKRSLAALLVEKGEEGEPLITFFHRQVAEVVRAHFYEPEKAALHAALAAYFDPPAENAEADPHWTRRSFIELPFQLFHAGMRERLDALLIDPAWIDLKVRALAGARESAEDYQRFAKDGDRLQSLIGRTLQLCTGILARDPHQAMVQLHGRLLGLPEADPFIDHLFQRIPIGTLYETRPSLTPPGAELSRLEGRKRDAVRALAVLADGRLVIGSDDTIRVWSPATGEGQEWLVGATELTVLPNGRLALGGGPTILIWNPDSGAILTRLEGHEGSVNALAVLPDGRLASGSNDDTIRLWDTNSGAQLARLEGHRGGIMTLAVLADGSLASASGWDFNTIRLRDPESGAELARLHGHDDSIHALATLPGGRLASGSGNHESGDCTIRLWDVASGVELMRLEGHDSRVTALAVLPDGRLVSGSDDQTIRIWDPVSGAELARLNGHENTVTALAVLADGRIASGSTDDTVRIWDLARDSRPLPDGHRREVTALAVLPDGRVVSGSEDNTIRVWDPANGQEVARLSGHSQAVVALVVLTDGRLASASDDNTIRLWHPASGQQLGRLEGHQYGRLPMVALPDGRLASGSAMTIYLWDTASGAVNTNPNRLSVPEGGTRPNRLRVLITLTGGRLIAGTEDATIHLLDTATGEELARLEGHQRDVNALALLPNGWLASASWDETIRVWDLATAKELKQLLGHHGSVNALAALEDGRFVSVSNDKTIRVWDATSLGPLDCLEVDAAVGVLQPLSDGRVVAGDSLGRLHWLAIKGTEARAQAEPSVRPPGEAATREALTDPSPARLEDAPTAEDSRQPRAAPPKRKGRAGLWAIVILVIVLATFAAATLDASALRDLWSAR